LSYNPPQIPEEAEKMAKKFFDHAGTIAETRNYDYAIELYLQGLAKNPQAIEKGHKALREIAVRRKLSGGKKPGIFEALKRNTLNKKEPIQGLINAEYLFARDPFNITYIEAMVKASDMAELPETLNWCLNVFLELARQDKKLSGQRFLTIKEYYEKLGDYYDKADNPDQAIECYKSGLSSLDFALLNKVGGDLDLVSLQRNLAGKLTILKGKYERAGSFRESIRDAKAQEQLQNESRTVKSEELLEEMIVRARQEQTSNPEVIGKINSLCDLLLQRGAEKDENEAIEMLQSSFDRMKQYSLKMRADDVRMRQMNRKLSDLKDKAASDSATTAEYQEEASNVINFEIDVFRERVKNYPTDLKIKFEYARRLFRAKRFDDAIPVFQEVLSDPRNAIRAKYHIGMCFYQKGWHQQAIDVLNEAISAYEITADNLSKEMNYILGRSLEETGGAEQALKVYSKLIQWDFNYRDVRTRIDNLRKR
jgi:TolA-binding protein